MNRVRGYEVYAATSVGACSPERLVVLAYEKMGTLLSGAEQAMAHGDFDTQNNALQKTQCILSALQASLDPEVHPVLAQSLSSLYDWYYMQIGQANVTSDLATVRRVRAELVDLGEAWRQAEINSRLDSASDPREEDVSLAA